MRGNILLFGKKIFEIPPFFGTRPKKFLGKKVHACSLGFSALKDHVRRDETRCIMGYYSIVVCEVSRTERKVQDYPYASGFCFRVVDDVPEEKGMYLGKQISSSKCSFTCICGIFLPLNPSTTVTRSAFYASLRYSQSAVFTLHIVCILPLVCSLQSAVHSPQSSFYTDRFSKSSYSETWQNTQKTCQRTEGVLDFLFYLFICLFILFIYSFNS